MHTNFIGLVEVSEGECTAQCLHANLVAGRVLLTYILLHVYADFVYAFHLAAV